MINIPGQLAIRTINGRNGEFNVGKLSTSIGEFVIKDALLDQHIEGKYRGDFAITEIRPSYYTTGGRLVVEIRAKLDSMTLDDVDNLSDEEAERLSGNEVDPLDEVPAIQQPTAAPAAPPKSPQKPKPLRPAATGDDAPFGMDPPAPAEQAATLDTDADAELFGTVVRQQDNARAIALYFHALVDVRGDQRPEVQQLLQSAEPVRHQLHQVGQPLQLHRIGLARQLQADGRIPAVLLRHVPETPCQEQREARVAGAQRCRVDAPGGEEARHVQALLLQALYPRQSDGAA